MHSKLNLIYTYLYDKSSNISLTNGHYTQVLHERLLGDTNSMADFFVLLFFVNYFNYFVYSDRT